MTIHYAYFCDDCGHTHTQPTDECVECGSFDIERAPHYASVDYDDAKDDARLAQIRAESKSVWEAMDAEEALRLSRIGAA